MNPNKRYRLGITYYFEREGSQWRMQVDVDGRMFLKTKINSKIRVDDSGWLPPSLFRDGEILVEIIPIEGDFALCNEIALYEFEDGGGAPQEGEILHEGLPTYFDLSQSYPNPFSSSAIVKYHLPIESDVSLKVYNVTGQLVREVVNEKQKPGFYLTEWDGKDYNHRRVSGGVYFYRFEAGDFKKIKKWLFCVNTVTVFVL